MNRIEEAPMSVWMMLSASRLLELHAKVLDDIEQLRIANSHRRKAFVRIGFTLPDDDATMTYLEAVEAHSIKELERAMRAHPLGPWVKAQVGLGDKMVGRLLGAIGDPYWNLAAGRPRTVSQLWAYCGYHVLHPGHAPRDAQTSIAGVELSAVGDHSRLDTQKRSVPGGTLLQSGQEAVDTHKPAARLERSVARDQLRIDTQADAVPGGILLQPGHAGVDAQGVGAGLEHFPVEGQSMFDTHSCRALDGPLASGHLGQDATDTHTTSAGVAPKRTKGVQSNWSTQGKMRAYLLASKCVMFDGKPDKNGNSSRRASPYRKVYDAAREKYVDAVHAHECRQCGICISCGKPPNTTKQLHAEKDGCSNRKIDASPVGSPLKLGHKDGRAKRIVAKEILKDLWIASREWHLSQEN